MRFSFVVLLAVLPGVGLAQDAAPVIEKADTALIGESLSPDVLGTPANPDAAKTTAMSGSKAADATPSDLDADKIAGNAPVSAPMSLRQKAPGSLPDLAPAAADLGTGPDGDKTALLDAGKGADGRTTTYDTDKVDGNPEVTPPLALRQKAPGTVPEGVTEADFGQPTAPADPKLADLAARHADGHATIYDEDKIDGNEPPPAPLADRQKAPAFLDSDIVGAAEFGLPSDPDAPKTADIALSHLDAVTSDYDEDKIDGNETYGDDYALGPLAERQKYPADLPDGADPTTFGEPAIDAPKLADLAISKAALNVPNVEDNDKIAGNPYIAPPLLPRQKAPSTLPDPVVDANTGQPAADAPKVDLAVGKAADAVPTVEDNDKIAGNAVVAPPMAERSKSPSYEAAVADLSDADLGLPANPDAAKLAEVSVAKAAEAVPTEYDEDKIAGNSYQDPAFDSDEGYALAPPPELVAQVRALLDDPATRGTMLDAVMARGLAPEPVAASFQSFVGLVFDVSQVRDVMATDVARVFMEVGLTPDSPVAVGRMAAEYMAAFGEDQAARGTARRSTEEQRAYLADTLRIAEGLTPEQCGPYLDGTMDAAQKRRLMLGAIATWDEDARNAVLIQRAAAIMADMQDDPALNPMPDADAAQTVVGTAALAAIDAADNGPALLAAFGDPFNASVADHCAVQKLILQAALADTSPDADIGVRYLVEFGWQD